jgi:hypothetical protein
MGWKIRGVLVFAWSIGAALGAVAGDLEPGMSQADVVAVIGRPDAVRLERNGVVCLTYEPHERRIWSHVLGARTRVIALKANRFVDDATIRSERVRFHCSRVAERWDPPWRGPLICDARWRRGC